MILKKSESLQQKKNREQKLTEKQKRKVGFRKRYGMTASKSRSKSAAAK